MYRGQKGSVLFWRSLPGDGRWGGVSVVNHRLKLVFVFGGPSLLFDDSNSEGYGPPPPLQGKTPNILEEHIQNDPRTHLKGDQK